MDAIVDVNNSAVGLAVNNVAREKNKVFLASGASTAALTGEQCSPNTVHWTYDTYMLAKSTGGGMVKVVLTGKGDLRRVAIDPSLMVADDREVLEDLLVAAHADAKQKVEATMAEEMQKATAGLNLPGGLPGGFKLPF